MQRHSLDWRKLALYSGILFALQVLLRNDSNLGSGDDIVSIRNALFGQYDWHYPGDIRWGRWASYFLSQFLEWIGVANIAQRFGGYYLSEAALAIVSVTLPAAAMQGKFSPMTFVFAMTSSLVLGWSVLLTFQVAHPMVAPALMSVAFAIYSSIKWVGWKQYLAIGVATLVCAGAYQGGVYLLASAVVICHISTQSDRASVLGTAYDLAMKTVAVIAGLLISVLIARWFQSSVGYSGNTIQSFIGLSDLPDALSRHFSAGVYWGWVRPWSHQWSSDALNLRQWVLPGLVFAGILVSTLRRDWRVLYGTGLVALTYLLFCLQPLSLPFRHSDLPGRAYLFQSVLLCGFFAYLWTNVSLANAEGPRWSKALRVSKVFVAFLAVCVATNFFFNTAHLSKVVVDLRAYETHVVRSVSETHDLNEATAVTVNYASPRVLARMHKGMYGALVPTMSPPWARKAFIELVARQKLRSPTQAEQERAQALCESQPVDPNGLPRHRILVVEPEVVSVCFH